MDIQRSGARSRRRFRAWAGAGGGAALVALAAFGWTLAARPPAVDGNGIWSAAVTRGQLVHEVSAAGTLVAPELRAVTNRSEGVVERILVLPGHRVEPDTVLVEMSSPQLEQELADARWELDYAEAESVLLGVDLDNTYLEIVAALATAEAEYTSARLELEAQEELGEQAISSEIEVERARLSAEQWLKRLEAEQARLDRFDEYRDAQREASNARLGQLQDKVARLEKQIAGLAVRAGMSGVVQEINVEEGQRLGPGEAVARIVNPQHLIARVRVSERDAAEVAVGLPVRLEVGRDTLAGKVTRIDPTVRDRLVTVDVGLAPSVDVGALRPDLSVTARIELERLADVMILDRPVGLDEGGRTIELFRLERDGGAAERVSVEIGRVSSRQVEIVRGLDVGDRVILADLSEWLSEPRIRIR